MIITTRMPARGTRATPSATLGRHGSASATKPSKRKAKSRWIVRQRADPRRRPAPRPARAGRRGQRAAITAAARGARCAASRRQRSAIASGAPFAATISRRRAGARQACDNGQELARERISRSSAQSRCEVLRAGRQRLRRSSTIARSIGSNGSAGRRATANSSSSWKLRGQRVAPAAVQALAGRPTGAHRHAVLGERAGLVDAQHGGRAERLDRRHAPRQHVVARDAPGARARGTP